MTTPRPDPVTEAGRALLDHEMGDRDVPGNDLYLSADEVRAAIIAIEQEAAALALARAEAGVSVEALAAVLDEHWLEGVDGVGVRCTCGAWSLSVADARTVELGERLYPFTLHCATASLAALAAEPRGSSGVVEQSATQRKHEYHSERTDFDFWCIASCHDDGRCDGECDPDCESCPIPCPLCEAAAPPATGPVVVGTMTEEEGRAFIEAATGTAPPETDTTPHASSVPHATGAVERECVCSVRADDCGLPCPCWHHTPAPAPSPPATGTVERCGWCGGSGRITSGSAVCPTCHGTGKSAPTPAPSPSAALVEADDALRTLLTLSALLVSVIDSGEVLSDHDRATIRAARGKARAARRSLAAARAEAGVSLEEMGKAWAAVEAALPEHRYFKVEHDSDDDPSWYLAVWRSDGIFPDPIRWAQADTLLDGLTRLALELRTPR